MADRAVETIGGITDFQLVQDGFSCNAVSTFFY